MTIWRENPDWKYEYFDANASSDNFVGFEDIVDVWRCKSNNGKLPAWSDFDFYDFKGWHGFVGVAEYLYEPVDNILNRRRALLTERGATDQNALDPEPKTLLHPFSKLKYESSSVFQ